MGATALNRFLVEPTTIDASSVIPFGWPARRSAHRISFPRTRLRSDFAQSALTTTPSRFRLPSWTPSSGSLAKSSRHCSTLDPVVPVTLPGGVR